MLSRWRLQLIAAKTSDSSLRIINATQSTPRWKETPLAVGVSAEKCSRPEVVPQRGRPIPPLDSSAFLDKPRQYHSRERPSDATCMVGRPFNYVKRQWRLFLSEPMVAGADST